MKYKYIVHWFYSPRDVCGNVYSYAIIADTRSGRYLEVANVPESNLRSVIFALNGNQHKQNYWWAQTVIPKRQLNRRLMGIPYIRDIPETFRKMMRSRRPRLFKA
jgi:hypothetical protein